MAPKHSRSAAIGEPAAVVLVEGASDRAAVVTLAARRGRDLTAEGVAVVAMGGAQAIAAHLARYGPGGLDLRLAGLYDTGEERHVARGLERAGLGTALTRPRLEDLGFWACEADLEDELIRALGPEALERIFQTEGELTAWRTFCRQPAQRDIAPAARLRRFLGTRSGRKIRYGRLLVEALNLDAVPRPLEGVLAHV